MRPAQGDAPAAAFQFLNGWADRILVVSLERATDRQARLRERLAGLRYELFPATDKLGLDRGRLAADGTFDESRTPRRFRHGREMNLGEIGCALSHRRIYEAIVREGRARTVVFEDDVVPRAGDIDHLPAALEALPAGWDLCYLGYTKNEAPSAWAHAKRAAYVALSPFRLVRWRTGEALRLLPKPFAPHLKVAGLHVCTHAYAVSLSGARKLLAAQTPIAYRADLLFCALVLSGELSAYLVEPRAFDQEHMGAPAEARSYVHG